MAEGKAAGPENGEAVVLQLHDAPVAAAAPVAASGGRGKPGVLRRFFQVRGLPCNMSLAAAIRASREAAGSGCT